MPTLSERWGINNLLNREEFVESILEGGDTQDDKRQCRQVLEVLMGENGSPQERAFIEILNRISTSVSQWDGRPDTIKRITEDSVLFLIEHHQVLGWPREPHHTTVNNFEMWNLSSFAYPNEKRCSFEFVTRPPDCNAFVLNITLGENVTFQTTVKAPKINANPDTNTIQASEGRAYRALAMNPEEFDFLNLRNEHHSDTLFYCNQMDNEGKFSVKWWDDELGLCERKVDKHLIDVENLETWVRKNSTELTEEEREQSEDFQTKLLNYLANSALGEPAIHHLRSPIPNGPTLKNTIEALDEAGVERVGVLGFARAFPDLPIAPSEEVLLARLRDRATIEYASLAIRLALEALEEKQVPFTTVGCGYSGQYGGGGRKVGAPLIAYIEGLVHAHRSTEDSLHPAHTFYPPMSVISSKQQNEVIAASGMRGYQSGVIPGSPSHIDTIASRTQFVVEGTWGDESPYLAALCSSMLVVEAAGRWTQIEMQNGLVQGKDVVILASPFNYDPSFREGSPPDPRYQSLIDPTNPLPYCELPFGNRTVRAYRNPADAAMFLGWRHEQRTGYLARWCQKSNNTLALKALLSPEKVEAAYAALRTSEGIPPEEMKDSETLALLSVMRENTYLAHNGGQISNTIERLAEAVKSLKSPEDPSSFWAYEEGGLTMPNYIHPLQIGIQAIDDYEGEHDFAVIARGVLRGRADQPVEPAQRPEQEPRAQSRHAFFAPPDVGDYSPEENPVGQHEIERWSQELGEEQVQEPGEQEEPPSPNQR